MKDIILVKIYKNNNTNLYYSFLCDLRVVSLMAILIWGIERLLDLIDLEWFFYFCINKFKPVNFMSKRGFISVLFLLFGLKFIIFY